MARKKLTPEQAQGGKIRWIKKTKGIFGGTPEEGGDIAQGGILVATPERVAPIRDHFDPIDPLPGEGGPQENPLQVRDVGAGKFVVINGQTNKPLSDRPLSREEVEEVVAGFGTGEEEKAQEEQIKMAPAPEKKEEETPVADDIAEIEAQAAAPPEKKKRTRNPKA